MRSSLFVCLWLTLLTSASQARSFDFSTLPTEMAKELVTRWPPTERSSRGLNEVDEVLRFLQGRPAVETALAEELPGGGVRFRVVLQKRVSEIRFVGFKALGESEAASLLGVFKGDPVSTEKLIEGGEKIRSAYRDLGHLNPLLDIDPKETDEAVSLTVNVLEGRRTEIRDFRLASADQELNKKLQERLKSRFKGPYTEVRLSEAQRFLQDYLRREGHLRAEVYPAEAQFSADEAWADVRFRLERVESYTVDFRGAKEISSRSLETEVLDLKNFVTANPNLTSEMSEKIRQAYLLRGFARVEVMAEESEGKTPFSRRITLVINEGPKVRIEDIRISGTLSRPPEHYVKALDGLASPLVKSGIYNKDDLEKALNLMLIDLRNEGFLLAKLISTRTQYNRERTRITFHINMDEGPQTLVESLSFSGNDSLKAEELSPELPLKSNEPLRLNQIEESIAKLKQIYREQGFLEMQLLNEKEDLVSYNENNTRARLLFRIFEGPQVKVAAIVTDGNSFTKERVILNELDFAVGDLLTPSKIEESVSRLQRTGYFGSVEIRTLEERTSVADRTVIVRVTERNPGVFTLGIGATNERDLTLRGYTGVAYRNLWGTGRGVSLRVEGNYNVTDIKYPELKATLGYIEPTLFNSRIRGRVNVSRSKTVADYETRKIAEVNQVSWSVERDFTSHITGIFEVWGLATINDIYIDESRRPTGVENSNLDIATLGPSLDIDYRDNPFNPTRGHYSRLSLEYSSPKIGSIKIDEYLRSTAQFNFYRPLGTSGWVWANSLRAGYLESKGKGLDGGVPYDKKGFILGGRSTLRGYEGTSEVFPNATDLQSADFRLRTKATMGLLKSEIRIPVWGNFEVALFYDGGTVRVEGLEFQDSYRDSAGFGLRYNTPVGPLSLEWGWKLDRRGQEDSNRFHLSMGSF